MAGPGAFRLVLCGLVAATPLVAPLMVPVPPAAAAPSARVSQSGFEPSVGLTRSQVESRFREIDGSHTVFKPVPSVRGVPRVLGGDRGLYSVVGINGFPEVVDVQVVTLLDIKSKATLENQVVHDSLTCGLLASEAAQGWCTGRILNTNSHDLVTATKAQDFGPIRISVKTYQPARRTSTSPPVVSINISAS